MFKIIKDRFAPKLWLYSIMPGANNGGVSSGDGCGVVLFLLILVLVILGIGQAAR